MAIDNFTILDGELISYFGNSSEIVVPEGVRVIMEGAFLGCTDIEKVTLPEGVEVIRRKAFWGCTGLREITLPSSLRSIEFCAFRECSSLVSIEIPEGTVQLGDTVFRGCEALEKAVLPDTLETVSASCFQGCISLQRVVIPDSVRKLDKGAFLGCSSLQEVTLPKGLRTIERQCFEGCRKLMKLNVPDSVEVIGGNAFYKSGIMTHCKDDCLVLGRILVKYLGKRAGVLVPDGVRCIGDHAFAYSDILQSVILPDTVTEVQDYAFERCTALETVILPEGLKRLGKGAFTDCKALKTADLPPNLDHIGARLFYGSSFEARTNEDMFVLADKYLITYKGSADRLVIPDGIEVIADEAFVQCGGVREISLPYGMRTIGDSAFRWRSELKKVSIPSTVSYIGENAFVNCHEPEITIMNPKGMLGENGFPDGAKLRIVVSSRVLKIKLTWEVKAGDCPERRLWNFVCVRSAATFAVLQKPEYKLSCAICFYDDGKWYRDYIRKNIIDAVCFASTLDDSSVLERVLSFGLLDREQLQTCIEFAIEHKLTQQQVAMMRYRHEHFEDIDTITSKLKH